MRLRIPFRLVDVFTDRPLAGNQLCVVPDLPEEGLTPALMQALAAEIHFSETTFVTQASGDRYSMRIFTPALELPFAGHPTLGTAYVLAADGRIAASATQVTTAGEVPVEVDLEAGVVRMRQLPPVFGEPVADLAGVAAAAGVSAADLRNDLPMRVVSTGVGHLMAGVRTFEAVASAAPDRVGLLRLLDEVGAGGLYLFAADGGRAKARLFGAGVGVDEDPATGSAAGPLGAHLAEAGLLPEGRLVIAQGHEVGRPSTLEVDVAAREDGWVVDVGGGVRPVAAGAFDLDLA